MLYMYCVLIFIMGSLSLYLTTLLMYNWYTINFIELFNFSFFSITGWGIDLVCCDTEWFALETNRDHSVAFENAPENCILDSFVDC